jgi:hypothetical protein
MLDTRAQDHEIKAHALWSIGRVKTLLYGIGKTGHAATTSEELAQGLDTIAKKCHARPCADTVTLSGRIARMTDAAWWMRNLRRETVKRNEVIEHHAGAIRRKGQCYASDHAHKMKLLRARANRQTLENLEVVNEAGQAFNLLEIADKSISNPKLRRGELMTRARGFEEVAEFMGHKAIFLTITCPSRFHRWNGAGQQNKNWTGDTPRDAQDYLCATWAKIRSAWNRAKIAPYGFRVAEPHHDGCPHWHILLFIDAGYVEAVASIAQRYALKDTPGERGALKHRFTLERIDTTKGSATGYIAKYIAKNIDGLTEAGDNVGLDFASGTKASDSSARVKTWASTWGIRQFQQIGGPSVTVWRELRRLGEVADKAGQRDLFESAQDAADQANWMMFWLLQGGPDQKRTGLTLRPFYQADSLGKYGDAVSRITGITQRTDTGELYLQTRMHEWTVQRAGQAATELHYAERREDVKTAQNVARFLRNAQGFGIEFSGHRPAWTGVNNCTPEPAPVPFTGFDFEGFEPGGGEIPFLPEYSRAGQPENVAAEVAILEEIWEQTQYVHVHRANSFESWQ